MANHVWIQSNGGPLLLLPATLLTEWSGSEAPPAAREVVASFRWRPGGPATDYDRACDVSDYVGVIAVGAGEGLVLGEEPDPTTWLADGHGGILARWIHAPSGEEVAAALERVPMELSWELAGTFRVVGSPLVLFDAAEPGVEPLLPRLKLEVAPGLYAVAQVAYRPDAETALRLVRLQRIADADAQRRG